MHKLRIKIYYVIALLFVTYLLNNCAIPLSSAETGTLKFYESSKQFLSDKLKSWTGGKISLDTRDLSWVDSICLINTSFDWTLVDVYGERPFSQGKEPITNRKDLYCFLKIASRLKSYKYIILDIALDKKRTPYDDSLSILIPKMDNIIVARSNEYDIISSLKPKSGWVDYYKMPYESNFVKYNYGTRERKSLPLCMYNDLNKRDAITSLFGLFYFDGFKLCQKASILDFDIRYTTDTKDIGSGQSKSFFAYQNLGTDFNDESGNLFNDIEKIKGCIDNKIVLIGNLLGDDKHDTYVGEMPGAIINLNAFLSLHKGKHIVKFHHVLILFLFYLTLYILIEKKRYFLFKKISESDFGTIIVSIIGWSTFFNIIALLLYILLGVFFNPWYPTLWFTFVPQCVKLFKLIRSYCYIS